MIDKHSIDEEHAQHVSALLTEEPEPSARAIAKDIIDYYVKNFEKVQIVRCNKCGKDLCLEVYDSKAVGKYLPTHHEGMRRIEISGAPLLSSRKRLDGAMGYRCRCGNNTVVSKIELGILPTINRPNSPAMIPAVEPHHAAAVATAIAAKGYKPDIERDGNKTRIETFTVERIK